MDELIRRISAEGFAAIEGLEVTGTLPVRQDIVNEVITGLVREAQAAKPAGPEEINWWKLVNKLQVQLKEGKLVIDFELRR